MNDKGPIIELPADQAIIDKLHLKLEEYKRRLDTFKAPEQQMGTIYKIAILEELFRVGKVSTYELSRKLSSKHGGFNLQKFENSCGVIHDYCLTGGQHVRNGCLPKIANS